MDINNIILEDENLEERIYRELNEANNCIYEANNHIYYGKNKKVTRYHYEAYYRGIRQAIEIQLEDITRKNLEAHLKAILKIKLKKALNKKDINIKDIYYQYSKNGKKTYRSILKNEYKRKIGDK